MEIYLSRIINEIRIDYSLLDQCPSWPHLKQAPEVVGVAAAAALVPKLRECGA